MMCAFSTEIVQESYAYSFLLIYKSYQADCSYNIHLENIKNEINFAYFVLFISPKRRCPSHGSHIGGR